MKENIMTIEESEKILKDNLFNIQKDTSLSVRIAIENVLNRLEELEEKNNGIKKCVICGGKFKSKRKDTVYCSEECKKKRRSENFKKYYKEHKQEIMEKYSDYRKEYRKQFKERIKKYAKEYRETHKEKIKEYRENHKEKMKVYQKAYRDNQKKLGE